MSLTSAHVAARAAALFAGLRPLQISEIVRRAERCVLRDGQSLIVAGERGEMGFLVVEGQVRITGALASAEPPAALGPGTIVGEMAMLIEHEHAITVIADGPVKALRFPRTMIEELMQEDPDIAEHLVSVMAERLAAVARDLRRISADLGIAPAMASDARDAAPPAALITHMGRVAGEGSGAPLAR